MKQKISEQSNKKLVIFIFPTPATIASLKVLTKYYALPFDKVLSPAKEIFKQENLQTGIEKVTSEWGDLLEQDKLIIVNFKNAPMVFLNSFLCKQNHNLIMILPDNLTNHLLFSKAQKNKINHNPPKKIKPYSFLKDVDLLIHRIEHFIHQCKEHNREIRLIQISDITNPKSSNHSFFIQILNSGNNGQILLSNNILKRISVILNHERTESQIQFEKENDLKDFIGKGKQYLNSYFKI